LLRVAVAEVLKFLPGLITVAAVEQAATELQMDLLSRLALLIRSRLALVVLEQ
jgi:hypothetical protein